MMLSLQEKIGQMLMVGFDGLEAPDYILEWLEEGRVGGIILFTRNISTPSQVAGLTSTLHKVAKYPILIAIDQEGGIVTRLREGFTESPGAMALGAADSEELAEEVSAMLATEMRALGINWNFAPVVDISTGSRNPSVGIRSLGADATKVGRMASAQVRGFQKAGVAACSKHFPGKGDSPVDAHVALPVISGELDLLWERDLVPFRATVDAGVATVMITHARFEALEPDHPSTLSRAVATGLLRDEVGFTGAASTDCLEMRAVTDHYGAGESAVLAALAGVDNILFSHTRQKQDEAYNALLQAAESGRLPVERIDESVARMTALKERFAIIEPPQLNRIRHDDHLAISQKAARAGTVLLCPDDAILPLRTEQQIALIEFMPNVDSLVMEQDTEAGLSKLLREQAPEIQCLVLDSTTPQADTLARAKQLANDSDVLIVATRNAHFVPKQAETAQGLLDIAGKSILLCLRNPYDIDVLSGKNMALCTFGDAAPSLQAAVDALLGRFTPTGELPVPLRNGD